MGRSIVLAHQPHSDAGMTYPIGRFQWYLALASYILVNTPEPSSFGYLLMILLDSSHQAEMGE